MSVNLSFLNPTGNKYNLFIQIKHSKMFCLHWSLWGLHLHVKNILLWNTKYIYHICSISKSPVYFHNLTIKQDRTFCTIQIQFCFSFFLSLILLSHHVNDNNNKNNKLIINWNVNELSQADFLNPGAPSVTHHFKITRKVNASVHDF